MEHDIAQLGLIDEDEIVLDEAALALALLDHAGADAAPYRKTLAAITARLQTEGAGARGARDRAAALAQVLAAEFGFGGDRETYDDPDNADLIRVIDRRRGLPVSLSILHVAAARRVGWSADVLNVPGHVLVLIGGDGAPVIADPFRGGLTVEAEGLAALLAAASNGPAPVHQAIEAMPNRAILVRLLLNQATRAEAIGRGRRALTLYERMTVMAPGYAHAWWERARLELVDDDVPAARRSLSAMLEITREPELRGRIAEMLGSLAGG